MASLVEVELAGRDRLRAAAAAAAADAHTRGAEEAMLEGIIDQESLRFSRSLAELSKGGGTG